MLTLSFDAGSLVIEGPSSTLDALEGLKGFIRDPRVNALRAPARYYRSAYTELYRRQSQGEITFEDRARAYDTLDVSFVAAREPFPHQREALDAWVAHSRRGVVVLPTGSGKTFVAELAIALCGRSTLVVAPTLDLVGQWYDGLSTTFGTEVGLIGGGYYDPKPLCVTTYDSAFLHMERLGNLYALIVFDECHHLPSTGFAQAAHMSLAPFRLGLTATPERSDDKGDDLDTLVGPTVFRKRIKELSGLYLAEYETIRIAVPLCDSDGIEYAAAREVYRSFVRSQGIRVSSPGGWGEFVMRSSVSREGRKAMKAYRRQKQIALAHSGKITQLEGLLKRHAADRVLIFTNDNDTVYEISRRFLLPAITHKTPTKERKATLERFNAGDYPCIVASKVLNEGVNVPDANVAIVLSGSASTREHVQRLGRILRRTPGKAATLYELITEGTLEEHVSSRRRDHDAYR